MWGYKIMGRILSAVWTKILAGAISGILVIFVAMILAVKLNPQAGANGADELRKILGDRPVAALEMAIFQVEDLVQQAGFALGIKQPVTPWAVHQPAPQSNLVPSGRVSTVPEQQIAQGPGGGKQAQPGRKALLQIVPPAWVPPQVNPMGTIAGEGIWQPYLQDAKGETLAYRTFLQPDPKRPYSLVGLVAFDLSRTHLHFQLGFEEPYADGVAWKASGSIPAGDLVPGKLVAAFNGGFKVRHGHFGAMLNGKTAVPPRDGMATLVFYKDGRISLGPWDPAFLHDGRIQAYRQNGPLVIDRGNLNPQTDDPNNWGYTLSGGTVTWRSGLGISQDGRTLYYLAGPNLTIHTLAAAMQAAGIYNAMQLDINNYWVHFNSFAVQGGKLTPEALFPEQANENPDRFLHPYARDFFYVTAP